ncbi:MAG: hypothetical protein AAB833_01925 [Patescibacteria group bacterium]
MKSDFLRSKLLKFFPLLLIVGLLFAGSMTAASIFSYNAEIWFAKICIIGVKGINAGVCDLQERVIEIENTLVPSIPKTLIVKDADGEYVGLFLEGLASSGVAYNEIENQFLHFETNQSHFNNELIGTASIYIYFTSPDCTGQPYSDNITVGDNDIKWSGSDTSADSHYIYTGDGTDSISIEHTDLGSYYQPGLIGCQLGGSGLVYPVQFVDWVDTLNGPFQLSWE